MDELLNDFLAETTEHLDAASTQLVQFESEPSNSAIVASIFRLVHTIKGTCGFLGLTRLEAIAHVAEAAISRLREGRTATPELVTLILAAVDRIKLILSEIEANAAEPAGDDADLIGALNAFLIEPGRPAAPAQGSHGAREPLPRRSSLLPDAFSGTEPSRPGEPPKRSETIRVDVSSLERIMVLVSELVLTRNQLLELHRKQEDEAAKAPMQRLSALTSDLQDSVMRARMQPLSRLFARLPRLVRELSVETGKRLSLIVDGGETELDRQLIEVIRDPLTHILRNAADHAIEPPEDRLAAGKSETGTIRISASHEAGYIAVSVADDGRGLDVEKIKAKALARGLIAASEIDGIAPEAVYRFIFLPGFSTAATVTNISGRGVGLDVVRENIETIGGSINVSSTFGKGTSFNLKIPLTLAIAPALIVRIAGHRFALPQQSVMEAIGLGPESSHRIERVQDSMVLRLRDKVLPLVDFRDVFKLGDGAGERAPDLAGEHEMAGGRLAVIMRFGAHCFGVLVDSVADVQEIVVKPLGASLAHLYMFSGHTILGDGSVVLILDPVGLARTLGLSQTLELGVQHVAERFIPPREKSRMVLFKAGEGALKVVPLSLISRIESAASGATAISDGRLMMQHRGFLMPLLPITGLPIADIAHERPVLVLGIGGESVGLVVDEIIDIVEDFLDIEIASATPGIIGSARIGDTVVEIIDISHFVRIARPDALARGVVNRFSVLLVDDRLFFRDMLAPILAAAGFRVTTASSGRDALFLLAKGAMFHAVITDTDMPEMDGYTLAREIRRNPRNQRLPVIALAANAAPITEEAAAAAGMCGVVGKFDRSSLLTLLRAKLDVQSLGTHALEERIIRDFAAGVVPTEAAA